MVAIGELLAHRLRYSGQVRGSRGGREHFNMAKRRKSKLPEPTKTGLLV